MTGWGTPPPNQQNEHLLRRGQCASCVHAGGLSCFYSAGKSVQLSKKGKYFHGKWKICQYPDNYSTVVAHFEADADRSRFQEPVTENQIRFWSQHKSGISVQNW